MKAEISGFYPAFSYLMGPGEESVNQSLSLLQNEQLGRNVIHKKDLI
jgi:hypothetical protein